MNKEFILEGRVDYEKGGAGNSGSKKIYETFDAEDLEQAKIVALAMMQSNKNKILKSYQSVDMMEAILFDENRNELLRIKFVPQGRIVLTPAKTINILERFEVECI